MQNETTIRTEEIGLNMPIPVTQSEVVPLNYQAALASFTEVEQKEIIALADSIDVTKIDHVMN